MSIRDEIDSAVGAVLFNASNYPKPAMPHVLGQDIGPLREKVVEAVLESVQPTPSAEPRIDVVPVPRAWLERLVPTLHKHADAAMIETAGRALDGTIARMTAEPKESGVCHCGTDMDAHTWADGHNPVDMGVQPAEPPSITDMAPGTEFFCEGKGVPGVEHHMRVTKDAYRDGTPILWCLTHKFGAAAPYVDQPTIRDVTPPK